ncbi:GrpB family protein [Bacillus sp. KH172YL63]|uniref:GrpB family protein n=1 Tax=Bacillus sp. KH172YL63 TaxID=2709784 RepID=UPI003FA41D58
MSMNRIQVCEYRKEWEIEFLNIKSILEGKVGHVVAEHIGSTAVKGLAAKPILDIDLVIGTVELFRTVREDLEKLGYFYQPQWSFEGRDAFGRRDPFTPWDGKDTTWMNHHLYVCPTDSVELARHLAFRDYLRSNWSAVEEYSDLKKRLAESFISRTQYTEGKTAFIERVLKKALS